MIEQFEEAKKGRKMWLELKKRYSIDSNWFLIIMPTSDDELNKYALNNLNVFLGKKYVKNALIICMKDMIQYIETQKDSNIKYEIIEKYDMKNIIKYYRLQQFFRNIAVISLEKPFGNEKFVGHMGVSKEEYIEKAIYA